MAVDVEVRNPLDLTTTFDRIEIERATSNDSGSMSNIATVDIDTTTKTDLSAGYTAYSDSTGVVGTHWYRFRYENEGSGAVSSYSDIFAAGGSVLQARFRRLMRDVNSNDYFFSDDDLDFFEEHALQMLWPITWQETYSDSAITPDGTTEVFTFPIGTTRLNGIQVLNSSGSFATQKLGWTVRGRNLIFDVAPRSGVTYRMWMDKMFLKLSEVPEIWDTHILNRMKIQAYETMEADRSRFYKYNSIAKPEGGNLPSLDRIITRLEIQIKNREAQLRRVRRPASIKLV